MYLLSRLEFGSNVLDIQTVSFWQLHYNSDKRNNKYIV